MALDPKPEVVILGNDPGTSEICQEYGLIHIPHVKRSKAGTPYCNSFIKLAEKAASNNIMLLCSGDIIVSQNTIEAAGRMMVQSALQEWCICPRKKHVERQGDHFKDIRWATWQAGDYWMHTKGIFEGMPPFLIGRHRNEKWMYRWLINKNALIDGTEAITVLHQKHPHDFKPSNKEIEYNAKLYEENYFDVDKWKDTVWYKRNNLFNVGINHANYVMTGDFQLVENTTPRRVDWKEL